MLLNLNLFVQARTCPPKGLILLMVVPVMQATTLGHSLRNVVAKFLATGVTFGPGLRTATPFGTPPAPTR